MENRTLSVHHTQPMFDTEPGLTRPIGDAPPIRHTHPSNPSVYVTYEPSLWEEASSQGPDRTENTLSSCFLGSEQIFFSINATVEEPLFEPLVLPREFK